MNEPIQNLMYIITVPCYKCDETIKVAMIEKGSSFYGPEAFSIEEKNIAERSGVVIKDQHSYTRQETYTANTCPYCNAFVGQHFLFTDYLVPMKCGDYENDTINLSE